MLHIYYLEVPVLNSPLVLHATGNSINSTYGDKIHKNIHMKNSVFSLSVFSHILPLCISSSKSVTRVELITLIQSLMFSLNSVTFLKYFWRCLNCREDTYIFKEKCHKVVKENMKRDFFYYCILNKRLMASKII